MDKRFLFFDVECANCKDGAKLYSFGYVATDEKFNMVGGSDLLINPACIWDWWVVKKLSVKNIKEEVKEKPKLYAQSRYPRIKQLLENKNNTILGFDVGNDIKYLGEDIERYKLRQINYTCFDVRQLHKRYFDVEKSKGLKETALSMEIDCSDIREHVSHDDAMLTMLITKNICNNTGLTINELLEQNETQKINSIEYFEKLKIKNKKQDSTLQI